MPSFACPVKGMAGVGYLFAQQASSKLAQSLRAQVFTKFNAVSKRTDTRKL